MAAKYARVFAFAAAMAAPNPPSVGLGWWWLVWLVMIEL
jgi:hypothetical protein